ncbi:hypothetical protein C2845_PM08G05500 [Panicum miliaceum]|uniref:Lecithin-cholesterol acyltransferase-like 1 n=1 Tax=Panicum miliaceum TaxID=4540 RepID=A0A3L6QZT4_PANMI|nr:hypothetical protein C2845_PM08G05500 [Panicum miliaceum]
MKRLQPNQDTELTAPLRLFHHRRPVAAAVRSRSSSRVSSWSTRCPLLAAAEVAGLAAVVAARCHEERDELLALLGSLALEPLDSASTSRAHKAAGSSRAAATGPRRQLSPSNQQSRRPQRQTVSRGTVAIRSGGLAGAGAGWEMARKSAIFAGIRPDLAGVGSEVEERRRGRWGRGQTERQKGNEKKASMYALSRPTNTGHVAGAPTQLLRLLPLLLLVLPSGLREYLSPEINHRPEEDGTAPDPGVAGDAVLHPIVLVPGVSCSKLEARLTGAYRPSVPRCGAMKGKRWFGLWDNCSDLPAHHYVHCFMEQMSLVYDPVADDYRNLPGVETRVPNFGSARGFQINPEHP